MDQRSAIRTGNKRAFLGAASVLVVGFALLGLAPMAVHAADAGASDVDTDALAYKTRRQVNDEGQFYMAWWLPQVLLQAVMRDMPNLQQADRERMLRALEPYIVFALSRGEVSEHGLVNVHGRADLLRHSRLVVNGQTLTAAPADQNAADAQAALQTIKPALAAILDRSGIGIEFALYRPMPGKHSPDPTMLGTLNYTLYHKELGWELPLWTGGELPRATPAALPAAPAPVPVARAAVPVAAPVVAAPSPPAASPAAVPVAAPVVAAPSPPAASPAATAVAPARAPAATPIPVQRRKIDPTTGEEFPERYDYNPYTGQKLVSQ
ncbi:MAG: hypothetical protein ACLP2F_06210 [Steroidobacteraceae bacterium]